MKTMKGISKFMLAVVGTPYIAPAMPPAIQARVSASPPSKIASRTASS
jgi:hypothetical protein